MTQFSPLGWQVADRSTFVAVSLAIALGIAGTVTGSIALHRAEQPSIPSGVDLETLTKQANVNAEIVQLSTVFSSNLWCSNNTDQTTACVAFLDVLIKTIQELEYDLRPESEIVSDLDSTTSLKGLDMKVFKMADSLTDAQLKNVSEHCIDYTVTTNAFDVCILPKGVPNGVNSAAAMMAFVTKSAVSRGRRAPLCAGLCFGLAVLAGIFGTVIGGVAVEFIVRAIDAG